jgi:hypothetical protein
MTLAEYSELGFGASATIIEKIFYGHASNK